MTVHGNDEVRRAMRSPARSVRPDATLRAAAIALRDHDIGAVAVLDNGRLVGILSERDLVRALGDGLDTDHTPVAAVMADMPRVIDADSPLWAATMVMLRMGLRHLPVTDQHRTVGMLSIRDALAVMERDRLIEPSPPIPHLDDSPLPIWRLGSARSSPPDCESPG